jgi:Nucleotidyl transferase AbiEii toxin, Type IV TA system
LTDQQGDGGALAIEPGGESCAPPLWRDENAEVFAATVRAAAEQLDIQPLAVEKDYWVCRALQAVEDHAPGEIVFKGGTSLEKLRIVQRFSEDLDLLVVGEYPSKNAAKNALKRMCRAAAVALRAVERDSRSGGEPGRFWRHVYLDVPLDESPSGDAIADPGAILVELGQSGGRHPSSGHAVTSLLSRQLADAGVSVEQYGDLAPFEVKILHPARTLIEKLLRVNNFAVDEQRRDSHDGWPRIGRQFYDIWALLRHAPVVQLLSDRRAAAEVMVDCVRVSQMFKPDFPPPPGGFAASPAFDHNWEHIDALRAEHDKAMTQLYYGTEPPSFDDVLDTVSASSALLNLAEP